VQCTLRRSGHFFLRLAQPGQFRLQFLGELRAFRTDFEEEGFQIRPLYLLRGFLKAILPVAAPFNEMFHYIDRIIFVHFVLRGFDAGPRLRFGAILTFGTSVGTRTEGNPCSKIVGDLYDQTQIQGSLHDLGGC
jgi:hypothetical protein